MSTPMLDLQLLPIAAEHPEDVLIEPDGSVLTGVADGRILRVAAKSGQVTEVANTGGRPLGLEFMPDGRLLVCDSQKGLLASPALGCPREMVRLGRVALEPLTTNLGITRIFLITRQRFVESATGVRKDFRALRLPLGEKFISYYN